MKKIMLALVLLAAAGCEKPPPPGHLCDYCKVPQHSSRAYPCRQCGKVHWSCDLEKPLHAVEYSKGESVFKEKDAGPALGFSIKKCPE